DVSHGSPRWARSAWRRIVPGSGAGANPCRAPPVPSGVRVVPAPPRHDPLGHVLPPAPGTDPLRPEQVGDQRRATPDRRADSDETIERREAAAVDEDHGG